MGSSRLPGKVLLDVAGRPALSRLLARLRQCREVHDIVVATSVEQADDAIAAWADKEGVACRRGSESDVLRRVVEAHRSMGSDLVVEVTGDCPLLDPQVIDLGVRTFLENDCDVVSNTWKLSFPMGVDVQVFPLGLLEEVERTVTDMAVREHVSLHFYEHPERYRVIHLMAPRRWRGPELRFQLDYPEDLLFIREVYRRLEPTHGAAFGVEEVMALLRATPELMEVNRDCQEKSPR